MGEAAGIPPILVTGATEKSGSRIVAALEAMGRLVRRATRRPAKAGEHRFDLCDPSSWGPALGGVAGVALIRPPHLADIDATLGPFIDLVRAEGAGPILYVWVAGAERMRVLPHARVERRLMAGPWDWIVVRPDFFEVAQALSEATGRSIAYRPASVVGYGVHLRRRGLGWGEAAVLAALHVGLRFRQAERVDPTLRHLLDRPPRSVFDYIADHADLWTPAP